MGALHFNSTSNTDPAPGGCLSSVNHIPEEEREMPFVDPARLKGREGPTAGNGRSHPIKVEGVGGCGLRVLGLLQQAYHLS